MIVSHYLCHKSYLLYILKRLVYFQDMALMTLEGDQKQGKVDIAAKLQVRFLVSGSLVTLFIHLLR